MVINSISVKKSDEVVFLGITIDNKQQWNRPKADIL